MSDGDALLPSGTTAVASLWPSVASRRWLARASASRSLSVPLALALRFLASDAADNITGITLAMEGG